MSPPPPRHRYRIWFAKTGNLRLISHHDLMRLLHRAVRRAGIPVSFSRGFNPRPRISFHAPLAVSHEGLRELFEIQLQSELDPRQLQSSLAAKLPHGLHILDVERLPARRKTRVTSLRYSVYFPQPVPAAPEFLPLSSALVVRRSKNGKEQALPLADYLQRISLKGQTLQFTLKVNDGRTLRPDEVLQAAGLPPGSTSKLPRIVRDAVEIAD